MSGLRRLAALKRRKRLRTQSPQARARLRDYYVARQEALLAAEYRCAVELPGCLVWATDTHHRRRRSQGGGNEVENLVPACRACHQNLHDHPATAAELGFIERAGS